MVGAGGELGGEHQDGEHADPGMERDHVGEVLRPGGDGGSASSVVCEQLAVRGWQSAAAGGGGGCPPCCRGT